MATPSPIINLRCYEKKNVEISEGENFKAINIGNFNSLGDYIYSMPLGIDIPGKVFIGESIGSSGCEVSFQMMPPHVEIPFRHTHNVHEELYVIINGEGEFQVDEKIIPVKEGSIIRVSPAGKRTWRNNSDAPMVIMCIQCHANSITQYYGADGKLCREQ